MKRRQALMLLAGLLLLTATPVLAESTPAEAIAAIKKLGGKVNVDANRAVVEVRLGDTKVTDAAVEKLQQALPKGKVIR